MYDVLALMVPPYTESDWRIMLNRSGSLQFHGDGQALVVSTWQQALSEREPRETIAALESAARLPIVKKSAASTPKALAYRFIALALHIASTDRVRWDARNDFIDTADAWPGDPDTHGYLRLFPLATQDARSSKRVGIWHEPDSHYWAILRDDTPVALVSIDGYVYTAKARIDLDLEYRARGRKLLPVLVHAMGDLLP